MSETRSENAGGNLETPSVIDRLVERPYEFDFVQAVTLLENSAAKVPAGKSKSVNARVGNDHAPDLEAVRFRVAPTLRSFSSQVLSIKVNEESGADYELVVPFIGLTGSNGVLPRHYTQALVGRVKQRDFAMRDFFDLFHHRIVSMFFRASVKYRLPYVFQATAAEIPARDDSITQLLRCLTGLGEPSQKNRLAISDKHFIFYGGHFADTKPTGHSLERMVGDFCSMPVKVKQFQFEWLYIEPAEQTQLSAQAVNQLGGNMVIGQRVPSWQSRFRVRVGPVKWSEFLTLLPNSTQVTQLADLIRVYVGVSLDFDLQVAVHGSEVPQLALSSEQPSRLGWTSWITSEPLDTILEDAVFDIGKF